MGYIKHVVIYRPKLVYSDPINNITSIIICIVVSLTRVVYWFRAVVGDDNYFWYTAGLSLKLFKGCSKLNCRDVRRRTNHDVRAHVRARGAIAAEARVTEPTDTAPVRQGLRRV